VEGYLVWEWFMWGLKNGRKGLFKIKKSYIFVQYVERNKTFMKNSDKKEILFYVCVKKDRSDYCISRVFSMGMVYGGIKKREKRFV
jgi:hypothetical protein